MYGNFVLEFDWKALAEDKWDSGVYFRYDSVRQGQTWPMRFQVNLRQGDEGNVSSIKEAKSKVLIKAGKWNRFKLTIDAAKASMEINGKPAWQAAAPARPPMGYIALQAEVPLGGQHRFKNIYITELK